MPILLERSKKPTPWPAPRPTASSPGFPPPAPLPYEGERDISSIMPTEIDNTDDFPRMRAPRRFPRGTAGFVLGCAATMAATWALAFTGNFHVVTDTLTTHLAVPQSNLADGVHAASTGMESAPTPPPTTAVAAEPAVAAPSVGTAAPAAADAPAETAPDTATASATDTATPAETEPTPAASAPEADTTLTATTNDATAEAATAEPRRMTRAERRRALRQARIERRRDRIRARMRARRRAAAQEARAERPERPAGSVNDFLL